MDNYKNKKVAVLGLGIEGRDLVKFLLEDGASITIRDSKDEKEIDCGDIDKSRLNFVCGENYLDGLEKYDVIFRSPGVYRYKKELLELDKKGIEISSAIKLFIERCPSMVIGVTGTKGKGTTSTLAYEILKTSGKDVYLAGNIGKPCLELLPLLNSDSVVILELSSFQLIDLDISPHISIVLNVTSDHLDWHKNRKEYVNAKRNIVKHQRESDFVIINADYDDTMSFVSGTVAKCFYFSRNKKVEGVYVENNVIKINMDGDIHDVGNTSRLLLRGEHNWENITAALCTAKLAGADLANMKKAVYGFKGLEHRLELVKEVDDVKYYNDSFATGPQPVIAAVKSFSEPITLILGGFDKRLDYDRLATVIEEQGNVSAIVLIGDIAKQIKKSLVKKSYSGKILEMGKPTMGELVEICAQVTMKGGVVILSPGSSSFDMFDSYKQRGELFKKAVRKLQ